MRIPRASLRLFVLVVTLATCCVVNRHLNFKGWTAMQADAKLPPLRTHCVGRLMIDLPEDMQVTGDVTLIYGLDKDYQTIKVERIREAASVQDFQFEVKRRIAELKSDVEATPSGNLLAEHRVIDDSTTLIVSYREPLPDQFMEVLILRGDAIGKVSRPIFNNQSRVDHPRDIEDKLVSLARHITAIGDAEFAGKGTCLGGMLIDGDHDGEVFTLGARGATHLDVTMDIYMDSLVAVSDGGLLRRFDGKAELLEGLNVGFRTLRRGESSLAGRPAEELLVYGINHAKRVERQFTIETSLALPASISEPKITLSLGMGGQSPKSAEYIDPAFSEQDSLRLWDTIVKSVRRRPGAL